MSEEEIAVVRRLSGRFQGNVQEEIDAYHAAGDNWTMKTVALWDLIATILNALEAANRNRASVRKDALLEAAKATCNRCKNGDKLVSKQGKYYLHRIDVDVLNDYVEVNCDSEEIHQLIADEQGE